MTSSYMKASLLHKLRFVQRCPYLATEVGGYSADVLAIVNGKLTEYETKISMADFRADFNKDKHKLYRAMKNMTEQPSGTGWVPHQFYFAVPEALADAAGAYLLNYPEYGLVVIKKVSKTWHLREAPIILKRAQNLHKFEIKQEVFKQFLYRMGSEIAALSGRNLLISKTDIIE